MFNHVRIMANDLALLAIILGLCMVPVNLEAVEISDGPMEAMIHTAPPILMFLLDNSGSMNCELMTPDEYGLFEEACYIFPDDTYVPQNDHVFGANRTLSETGRRTWKTQWFGYNRLYYSPQFIYRPWPSTARHSFGAADPNRTLSNPVAGIGGNVRARLAAPFFTVNGAGAAIVVPNAHYFMRARTGVAEHTYLVAWEDGDGDGLLDLGGSLQHDRRKYYRHIDDGNQRVDDYELVAVTDEAEKNSIRPAIANAAGGFERYATDSEELHNFANWFSYHRRRELAAKAAVAGIIARSEQKYIGLYAVNGEPRMAVQPVRMRAGRHHDGMPADGNGERLLDALYQMRSGGNTPLRQALDRIGRYCHEDMVSDLGPSPYHTDSRGGGCQRASVVVVTDGFGNGQAPGVGNSDGDAGSPYADGWSDTLADVAMHYYENDLAPGLPDDIPPAGCDDARHQHLTTHALSFGMPGTDMLSMDAGPYKADTCLLQMDSPAVSWPEPYNGDGLELPFQAQVPWQSIRKSTPATVSDGLWHTAVNGRGSYLDIYSEQSLASGLPDLQMTADASAHASGIVVAGGLYSDKAVVYKAMYRTEDWTGDVVALSQGGNGAALWRAADGLSSDGNIWDSRRIVTYGGGWRHPQGIPFRYHDLSSGQMAVLGSDLVSLSPKDRQAQRLLEYIRGRSMDGYRKRAHLLGDVIHSGPVLFGQTLFVGANDGMLHAFNIQNGRERFAYVPNLVLPNLGDLASLAYPNRHICYVDGPGYVGEVMVGDHERKSYLVGGLGKGGKGYFCLLVGHRQRTRTEDAFGEYHWIYHVDQLDSGEPEQDVAQYIQWEYPRPRPDDDDMDNDQDGTTDETGETDPDLGYSFSQAYCVNGNAPGKAYRPVVIFGNGYNSDGRSAVLYVLSADTGAVVRKIDTGISEDNGLSTPALIDADLDRRVDYAYAGDLKGNLWKFDLTADSPARWGVAYGDDRDGDGVIDASSGDVPAPLFRAAGQPITGRPDVMVMRSICTPRAPGYMVVFGTGQYLGSPDRTDQHQQSIFGIWDFGDDSDDSEHLGSMDNRKSGSLSSGLYLVRQEIKQTFSYERNSQGELDIARIDYATVEDDVDGDGIEANNQNDSKRENPDEIAGWFYDFPGVSANSAVPAERASGDVHIRGGKAVIVSYLPDHAPCGSGGDARLYVLTACDGAVTEGPDGEPLMPIDFKGKVAGRPSIVKDLSSPRFDKVLTCDQGGHIRAIDFLGERWGKVSWHQKVDD